MEADRSAPAVSRLLLLRHGESVWNELGRFTGWVDAALSERGKAEAVEAGRLLLGKGLLPDVVHGSLLARSIETTELALASAGRDFVPTLRSWRLNERHYGALQGKDKEQINLEFGESQFLRWRRAYDVRPPPLEPGSRFDVADDPRYRSLAPELLPRTESLKDVVERVLPYWSDTIVPDLRAGRVVLVSAHGNSLRALVKHLDRIGESEIGAVDLPTGIPLLYTLDEQLRPLAPLDARFGVSGSFLDPVAAASSIDVVRNEGRTVRGLTPSGP